MLIFSLRSNIGLSAPQVSDFVKYGNLGINYYNGLLDMDIALPGYKDKDFDLSMSIKYVSSGFIPVKTPEPRRAQLVSQFRRRDFP